MKLNIPLLWRRVSVLAAVICAAGSAEAMTPASSVTLAPMTVLDSTSYHLDTLRSRIGMPAPCFTDKIGNHIIPEQGDSFWISYEGGYNSFGGDAALDAAYTRTWQGLLMGMERQLCCYSLVGVAFGYEESIARTAGARMDADTYFIDLYSAMRTGCWNHRMSLGVGLYDFSSSRGFGGLGSANGGADSRAVNVGYELSRDYRLDSTTVATPFMTLNYGFSHMESLHERIGPHDITTSYDDQNLLQMGFGGRLTHDFSIMSDWEKATISASLAGVLEFAEHRASGKQSFEGESFPVRSMKRMPLFAQLGVNLEVPMENQWEMTAGVFGRCGNDRGGVAGNVGFGYRF